MESLIIIIYSKVFKHFIQNSWFNETLLFRLWGLGMDLKFTHSLPCLPQQGLVFSPFRFRGVGQRRKFFTYLRCGSLSWVLRHSVLCVSCELTFLLVSLQIWPVNRIWSADGRLKPTSETAKRQSSSFEEREGSTEGHLGWKEWGTKWRPRFAGKLFSPELK